MRHRAWGRGLGAGSLHCAAHGGPGQDGPEVRGPEHALRVHQCDVQDARLGHDAVGGQDTEVAAAVPGVHRRQGVQEMPARRGFWLAQTQKHGLLIAFVW